MPRKHVRVTVPASSGNIGPGFDVLGLALSLRNELSVRVLAPQEKNRFQIIGEGEKSLPRDKNNLVYKAFAFPFKKLKRPIPPIEMVCKNRIPLARGLGSSAAAVLSGLLAANKILRNRFSKEEVLTMANSFEGHPDNVAPALYGGVRASGIFDGQVVSFAWPVPKCRMVVGIPNYELSTQKARNVLPKNVPLKSAVFNLAAVAVLRSIFENNLSHLRAVLDDRLHEPYRAKLVRGFYATKKAVLNAGAYGFSLSGAGPTVLSFCRPSKVRRVERVLKAKMRCRTLNLSVDRKGATVR